MLNYKIVKFLIKENEIIELTKEDLTKILKESKKGDKNK